MTHVLISTIILYAKEAKNVQVTCILLYIGLKSTTLLFSFVFFLQDANFPFHIPKMCIHLAPFISPYAQSMYI